MDKNMASECKATRMGKRMRESSQRISGMDLQRSGPLAFDQKVSGRMDYEMGSRASEITLFGAKGSTQFGKRENY